MAVLEDFGATDLLDKSESVLRETKELYEWLHEQPTNTVWFHNMLEALLQSLYREYRHLNIGYKKEARLLAWAGRNLLELHIYSVRACLGGERKGISRRHVH
jgi:hypothetical protein